MRIMAEGIRLAISIRCLSTVATTDSMIAVITRATNNCMGSRTLAKTFKTSRQAAPFTLSTGTKTAPSSWISQVDRSAAVSCRRWQQHWGIMVMLLGEIMGSSTIRDSSLPTSPTSRAPSASTTTSTSATASLGSPRWIRALQGSKHCRSHTCQILLRKTSKSPPCSSSN